MKSVYTIGKISSPVEEWNGIFADRMYSAWYSIHPIYEGRLYIRRELMPALTRAKRQELPILSRLKVEGPYPEEVR